MSKLRKSILIIGILVIGVAASLATALALFATGSIKTDPIELVYSVKDAEKVYDGTPLKAAEYRLTSGELIAGHTAQVDFIGEQTDVGVSSSDLQVKIYDKDGYNVSGSYIIKVESGELAVTPKHVSVEMPSQKVIYNGSKVNFTSYKVTEEGEDLVSGHVLAGSTETGLMNVGDKIPDDLIPLVFDKVGRDVTANYLIDFTVGDIEIIPRPISVRPVSYEKVYDGYKLECNEIEYLEGSLVEGQTATYTINGGYDNSLTGVGEISTYVRDFKVFDKINGTDVEVTSNYEISDHESGILKVTPRPLTVVAKSETWVYDGLEHTLVGDTEPFTVDGLAETDEIKSVHYVGTIKDVGTEYSRITAVEFSCNEDNYDITYIEGELTVTPFALHIKTGSGEKYYDGEALYNDELPDELANRNHILTIKTGTDFPEITDAGSITNEFACEVIESSGEGGSGVRVTDNYDITYEYGTLTVHKMPVTVTLSTNETVTYDATEKAPNLSAVGNFIIKAIDEEHTETLALTYENFTVVRHVKSMVDAGTYSYSVNFADKTLNNNYTLEVTNYGYLTIEQRAITVTTDSDKKFYDGTPLTCNECNVTEGSLVDNNEADIHHSLVKPKESELPSITDVGTKKNSFKVTIEDNRNVDVTSNYIIKYVDGTLTIEQTKLKVTLKDYTEQYCGTPYAIDATEAVLDINPAGIVTKEQLIVTCEKELLDAGDYTYTVKLPERLSKNLTLEVGNGNFKIDKREITVKIRNVKRTYTGEKFSLTGADVIHSIEKSLGLLGKDDFDVKFVAKTPVDVGSYQFELSLISEQDKKNFAPTYSNTEATADTRGTLTVEKYAGVRVATGDVSFVYDGKEHNGTSSFTHTALANAGHYVEAVTTGAATLTGVDETQNTFTVIIKNVNGIIVTGNYGDIDYYHYGTLSITKRPITITTPTHSKVYDGKAFLDNEATSDNFAEGHKFGTPKGKPSLSNVGSIENKYEVPILDAANKDVTTNYDVTYVYGTLTITKRPVTVVTNSDSKTYDAKPFSAAYMLNPIKETKVAVYADDKGFIAENYTAVLNADEECASITDAGSKKNTFTVIINYTVGALTQDVTSNFDITYKYGTLTVKPAIVNVKFNSVGEIDKLCNCVYDGKVKDEEVFKTANLIQSIEEVYKEDDTAVEGRALLTSDDFVAVFDKTILDAGKYAFTVRFKDGIKTSNYVFNSPIGTLLVNPMKIKVGFNDADTIFDNTVKTLSADKVIASIIDEKTKNVESALITKNDFVIRFVDGEAKYVKEQGYKFYAEIANSEKAKNFEVIRAKDGNLSIKPLPVSVTLKDYEFTYDDRVFDIGTDDMIIDTPLLSRSDFKVVYITGDRKGAGDHAYKVEMINSDYAKNFDVTGNEGGKITINALKVAVTLKDYEFTYSGSEPAINPADALTIGSPLLQYSDFTLDMGGVKAEVGTYTYKASLPVGTVNFITVPTEIVGTIKITPLPVTVTLSNPSKIYDGKEIDPKAVTVSTDNVLLSPADIEVKYPDTTTDRSGHGTYQFVANVKETTLVKSKNYRITVTGGTATVELRRVSIYTADKKFVYDGTEQHHAEILSSVNLAADHDVVPKKDTAAKIKYVGSIPNSMVCTISGGGKDVTDNYVITYYYGTLIMERKAITVTTDSANGADAFTYNGTAWSKDTFVCADAAGLTAVGVPKFIDVGTYTNKFSVKISEGGKDITDNYNITYVYGTIEIKPCPVTVTVNTGIEKDYIGAPIVIGNEELTVTCGTAGLIDNTDFEVTCPSAIRDAGTYPLSARIKDSNKAKNFNITVNDGSVKVKPINLNVTLQGINGLKYTGSEQIIKLNERTIGIDENKDSLTYRDFEVLLDKPVINAGDYTYSAKLIDSSIAKNYNLLVTDGKITVVPVVITVTLNSFTYDYIGKSVKPDAIEGINLIAGEGAACIRESDFVLKFKKGGADVSDIIDAGTYNYTAEIADSNFAGNFTPTVTGGTITVNKADVTVVLKNYARTYDGKAFNPSVSDAITAINGNGAAFLSASDFTLVYYKNGMECEVKAGGEYTYVAKLVSSKLNENFNVTCDSKTITVNKRTVTVTLDTITVSRSEYDNNAGMLENVQAFVRISNLADGDAYTVTTANVWAYNDMVMILGFDMTLTDAAGNVCNISGTTGTFESDSYSVVLNFANCRYTVIG